LRSPGTGQRCVFILVRLARRPGSRSGRAGRSPRDCGEKKEAARARISGLYAASRRRDLRQKILSSPVQVRTAELAAGVEDFSNKEDDDDKILQAVDDGGGAVRGDSWANTRRRWRRKRSELLGAARPGAIPGSARPRIGLCR